MKKLFFFFVITMFSFNVYAEKSQYICSTNIDDDTHSVRIEYLYKDVLIHIPSMNFRKYFEKTDNKDVYRYLSKHEVYVIFNSNTKTLEFKDIDTKELLKKIVITNCIDQNNLD